MFKSRDIRSLIRAFGSTLIGIIVGIAGIIGIYSNFFANASNEVLAGVIFTGGFAVYFFLAHLITRAKWEKYSRYPRIFGKLNSGFKEIHKLDRTQEDVNRENVITSFQKLCDFLAQTFTTLTGTKCSACIKILVSNDEDKLVYETLCRNSDSDEVRFRADNKTKRNNNIIHTLKDNTAFKEAEHNDTGYFISNRLPFLVGYKNTSFKIHGEPYRGLNLVMRYWKWKLPYKSTIVVPISPLHGNENDSETYGFLCIDSKKFGTFNSSYDTAIMKGVADGIYNTFKRFKHVV